MKTRLILFSFILLLQIGCASGHRMEPSTINPQTHELVSWEYVLMAPGICGMVFNYTGESKIKIITPTEFGEFSVNELKILENGKYVNITGWKGSVICKKQKVIVKLFDKTGNKWWNNGSYN